MRSWPNGSSRGESGLCAELWEQVRGFVAQQAIRHFGATEGRGGVEVDDLIQAGYIAMVEAVGYFDPEGGFKFITYLGNCLKSAFADAAGGRSEKQQRDPLHNCDSLERSIDKDDDGGTPLGDLQSSEAAAQGFAELEHRLWLEQLRATLNSALDTLPQKQREIVEAHYYQGKTLREIAGERGISPENVRRYEGKAFRHLRHNKRRLKLDEFVEQRTPYYLHVGVNSFSSTGNSAVERVVMIRETIAEKKEAMDRGRSRKRWWPKVEEVLERYLAMDGRPQSEQAKREYDAVEQALVDTRLLPDAEKRLEVIFLMAFDRVQDNQAVANQIGLPFTVVRRFHIDFMEAVGRNCGLLG